MSWGRLRKTGPVGGVAAILMARRNIRSKLPGSTTRAANLVTGRAMSTRFADIWAFMASYLIPASPAMTTRGACPRKAW